MNDAGALKSSENPVGDAVHSAHRMKVVADRYRTSMQSEKKREQLIEDYLPLVKSIVSRLRHHFPDYYESEDMYGVGAKALVLAVSQFNPSFGKSFGNYAALRIRGALLDELRRIDCLPRKNRAKAKSLQFTINALESKLKRAPTENEVMNELSLTPRQYQKMLKEIQPISFVPIDKGVPGHASDEGISLVDTLTDPTEENALEKTESREKVVLLREQIKKLPDQPKKILMLYYYEELKLSEIAEIFGLTEGRISQILSHTVLSLKAHFKSLN